MTFLGVCKFAFKILAIATLATTLSFAWTPTGSMHTARASHTATALTNGLVLVAGGTGDANVPLATSELYNSASGTWNSTGNLNTARVSATASRQHHAVGQEHGDEFGSRRLHGARHHPVSGARVINFRAPGRAA